MKQDIKEHLSDKALELINSGVDGVSIAGCLTGTVDELLGAAYGSVVNDRKTSSVQRRAPNDKKDLPLDASRSSPGLALLAVGGYGRRELAPYSDIDIMLLTKGRSLECTEIAERLLYRFWDMGLNISHCFRTMDECVGDAMADLRTRTALMEARFLAGDREVFEEFRRDVSQKLLFKNRKEFIRELLSETEQRHRRYGDSIYLLEPNVKEGHGGLRDVHAISWLARAALRTDSPEGLKGILSGNDYRHFVKAFDFLLKTRLGLHAASKRRNDILSFDFQERVAGILGFNDTKRFLAEEILMRLYYKKAESVTYALKKIVNVSGSRSIGRYIMPNFSIRRITGDFFLARNEIAVKDRAVLNRTDKILEAFHVHSLTGKGLSAQVREHIRSRLLFINRKTRTSGRAAAFFLDILRGGRVYETLREMHETGVLDRFIPEFGNLRNLVLYEPYHRYTVDEHSLLALKNAEALKRTAHAGLRYFSEIMKDVRQEVLYLAILLHDIGKGLSGTYSGRHEDSGYRILKGVLERLNVPVGDRRKIEFLVKNHIFLAKLALTRDADAPETTVQLAETVENEENLHALYLMTYADMAAVNPYFWTEWKAYLLHTIYTKTREYLRGVKGRRSGIADRRLKRLLEDMPERYAISNTDDAVRADYLMAEEAKSKGVAVSLRPLPDSTTEVTVVTADMPGLFSRLVGMLSFRGLNVLRASLYTGQSGLVIDKISVSNWQEMWWEGMEEQVKSDLKKAAAGEVHPLAAHRGACPLPRAKRFESFIEIDNEISGDYTILELLLPDRLGLLYDISSKLYLNGVEIISAVINTEDEIASDVFYLQYGGSKLDTGAVLRIVATMQDLVNGKKAGAGAGGGS